MSIKVRICDDRDITSATSDTIKLDDKYFGVNTTIIPSNWWYSRRIGEQGPYIWPDTTYPFEWPMQITNGLSTIKVTRFSVIKTDTDMVMTLDVPGYKEADINIEIKSTMLYVTGNSTKKGELNESYNINDIVKYNLEETKAEFEDCVLTITLPVKKEYTVTKIKINSK